MKSEPVFFSHAELKAVLQGALGDERAELAITTAAQSLGSLGATYSSDDALSILGVIAEHDGLVGISARFARSRMMSRIAAKALEAHGSVPFAGRGSSPAWAPRRKQI